MTRPNLANSYTRHSQLIDTGRRYLTNEPTPERFSAILNATDTGDLAAAVELNEEMEAKDAHLQGVANTRRYALTALPWEITPDESATDQSDAMEAADYVREQIRGVLNWKGGLKHLATAIGPGIAVLELIWSRGRLVEVLQVPGHRLMGDMLDGHGVFVETDDHLVDGIEATRPKFVTFTPDARSGFLLSVTITRAQAYLWIIKHYAIADWSAFAEVYGQPVRVATYEENVSPETQKVVKAMLQDMGSDMWALFPKGVTLELMEAARNSQPYGDMVEWIERKQSILYLGQTLTTEPGTVGSLALGNVHDSVRAGLTLGDIQNESDVVETQIFRWMLRLRFPGRKLPTPSFARKPVEARNLDADRLEIEKLQYLDGKGLSVDPEIIYGLLGIPMPKQDQESEESVPVG